MTNVLFNMVLTILKNFWIPKKWLEALIHTFRKYESAIEKNRKEMIT